MVPLRHDIEDRRRDGETAEEAVNAALDDLLLMFILLLYKFAVKIFQSMSGRRTEEGWRC